MARPNVAPIVLGVLFIIGLGVFGYFASTVETFPGEVRSSTWVQSWRTSWLDTAMKAVSLPGTLPVAGPVVLALSIGAYARGWRAEAVLVLVTTAAGRLVAMGLKEAIARSRPPDGVIQVLQETDSYAFPSGHAMHYAVLFGIIMIALSRRVESRTTMWTAAVAFVVAMLAVGVSRIYLGMHWSGDVVGGYAFGAGVVMAATWVWGRWSARPGTIDPEPSAG
jgi:undecaprenyl-diphosphatase